MAKQTFRERLMGRLRKFGDRAPITVYSEDQATIKEYQNAGYRGNPNAQYKLGKIFLKGEVVQYDPEMAFKWHQRAAEQGHVESQHELGIMYRFGIGISKTLVEKNLVKAETYFKLAAGQGHPESQYRLGEMHNTGAAMDPKHSTAMTFFKKAANQGHVEAQNYLGYMYRKGEGVDQDYSKAAEWLKRAAEQDNTKAQYTLGILYQRGEGVEQDKAQAAMWFKRAADKGQKPMQFRVNGRTRAETDKNIIGAKSALKKMLENGDVTFSTAGGFKLGLTTDQAARLKSDAPPDQAARLKSDAPPREIKPEIQPETQPAQIAAWYKIAADDGNSHAQFNLGVLYAKGEGVAQDKVEAERLFTLSAAQGNKSAQSALEDQIYEKTGTDLEP